MALNAYRSLFNFGVLTLIIMAAAVTPTTLVDRTSLNRSSFPAGFIFGTASSSYQYEGAANEGGRGQSTWDNFTHKYPGLVPFVTLFHWDHPQALQDEYGGFLSPNIINDFQDYAELCFKEFGDRVNHWITLNEPHSYSMGTEPYMTNSSLMQPLSKFIEPTIRFMQPMTTREYPLSMVSFVGNRLPKFTREQSKILTGSFDFIGVNYYTSNYAANIPHSNNDTSKSTYFKDTHVNLTTERNGIPIGPRAASPWLFVYPRGIQDLLLYTKTKYNNPLIYITENGKDEFNDPTLSLEEALSDTYRIDYFYRHLHYISSAIKHGVKVQGYFAWSLLDNFEWIAGYTIVLELTLLITKIILKDTINSLPIGLGIFLKNIRVTA